MAVIFNLTSEEPSVFFKDHGKYFVLGIYCYDVSIEELTNNANKISISFDQTDAQGLVLKDGISFEMELNITTWQDVADIKAMNSELIEEFLSQLGTIEKQWFYDHYQNARARLSSPL